MIDAALWYAYGQGEAGVHTRAARAHSDPYSSFPKWHDWVYHVSQASLWVGFELTVVEAMRLPVELCGKMD